MISIRNERLGGWPKTQHLEGILNATLFGETLNRAIFDVTKGNRKFFVTDSLLFFLGNLLDPALVFYDSRVQAARSRQNGAVNGTGNFLAQEPFQLGKPLGLIR